MSSLLAKSKNVETLVKIPRNQEPKKGRNEHETPERGRETEREKEPLMVEVETAKQRVKLRAQSHHQRNLKHRTIVLKSP